MLQQIVFNTGMKVEHVHKGGSFVISNVGYLDKKTLKFNLHPQWIDVEDTKTGEKKERESAFYYRLIKN